MQFGYSSTAIPTILSGKQPVDHKHLNFFYYDPDNSPFKIFKYLSFLPEVIFGNWRVRTRLSRLIAKWYGYTGYFSLYSVPFKRLPYFNYIEKKDVFVPGGLAPISNLADELEKRGVPYHISNWRLSESDNIQIAIDEINKGGIQFGFIYTAAMDALLHKVTKAGKDIDIKLQWYSEQVKKILAAANENYDEVSFTIISDHGMTTLTEAIDVQSMVESVPYEWGVDYTSFHDSTLGRYWFHNDDARDAIMSKLELAPHSRILSEEEKVKYGINFPDNMYGEEILLMDPGYQIAPCDLGAKPLAGMHGFDPEDADSYACLLSSVRPSTLPHHVKDYFRVMIEKIGIS
jgi:predicted AlkP superfamily pyrophosphatase or phosphodiesterase